ncbi:protein brambleberry isoform X2 [Denticeps clupeoides]|uniref:protein brambleberry isoform X2 n=1 Tax=Denticeps clupeoides TaxID=299321 RepID=UPI0010A53785|nr:protein brambleberry-like isoform X2 [Denticeps clupeoides]
MYQKAPRLAPWGLLLWVLAGHFGSAAAFFGWMKKAAPDPAPTPSAAANVHQNLPLAEPPPFEIAVADDKILAEAKQMELSPLDSCHFRVVAQLRSTCGSLSEENLAKLGVALFNCQAEVEGRRTFPCSEDMSIKECTADMDSDTWNAYHIVSNRARAVCYATRQQHFRRRAELTVNALISTATSQLDAMKDLKEGQRELRDLTAASLDRLLEGHTALQLHQGALKEGQEQLDASISGNLRRLADEKALISTGQELVAQLIQGVAQRMENMTEQLKGQGSEVNQGHQAIMEDLAEVRGRAQDIYSKMEENMAEFLQQQDNTAHFYSELLGKLERMNGTLGYMLLYLDNMQSRLEDRLHLIQGYLGWAGLSLCAVWTCVVHAGYFLLCALLLSFLQCPAFSRLSLLITVPVNAIAEVNQQPAFDLFTLTLLLFSLSMGRWFVLRLLWVLSTIWGTLPCRPLPAPPSKSHDEVKTTPTESPTLNRRDFLDCDLDLDPVDHDSFLAGDPSMVATSPPQAHGLPRFSHCSQITTSHSTPRLKSWPNLAGGVFDVPQRNLRGVLDSVDPPHGCSPNQSVSSNSSFSGRPLCSGTTKLGQPCKKRALQGQDFCRVHEGGNASYSRL